MTQNELTAAQVQRVDSEQRLMDNKRNALFHQLHHALNVRDKMNHYKDTPVSLQLAFGTSGALGVPVQRIVWEPALRGMLGNHIDELLADLRDDHGLDLLAEVQQ